LHALLQKKHYIPDTAIEFILKPLAVFLALLCRLYPVICFVCHGLSNTLLAVLLESLCKYGGKICF